MDAMTFRDVGAMKRDALLPTELMQQLEDLVKAESESTAEYSSLNQRIKSKEALCSQHIGELRTLCIDEQTQLRTLFAMKQQFEQEAGHVKSVNDKLDSLQKERLNSSHTLSQRDEKLQNIKTLRTDHKEKLLEVFESFKTVAETDLALARTLTHKNAQLHTLKEMHDELSLKHSVAKEELAKSQEASDNVCKRELELSIRESAEQKTQGELNTKIQLLQADVETQTANLQAVRIKLDALTKAKETAIESMNQRVNLEQDVTSSLALNAKQQKALMEMNESLLRERKICAKLKKDHALELKQQEEFEMSITNLETEIHRLTIECEAKREQIAQVWADDTVDMLQRDFVTAHRQGKTRVKKRDRLQQSVRSLSVAAETAEIQTSSIEFVIGDLSSKLSAMQLNNRQHRSQLNNVCNNFKRSQTEMQSFNAQDHNSSLLQYDDEIEQMSIKIKSQQQTIEEMNKLTKQHKLEFQDKECQQICKLREMVNESAQDVVSVTMQLSQAYEKAKKMSEKYSAQVHAIKEAHIHTMERTRKNATKNDAAKANLEWQSLNRTCREEVLQLDERIASLQGIVGGDGKESLCEESACDVLDHFLV